MVKNVNIPFVVRLINEFSSILNNNQKNTCLENFLDSQKVYAVKVN